MSGTNQRHVDLASLAGSNAPPLTTSEFAQILGMSATFIRSEIKTGHLRAVRMGHGRRRVFRIRLSDAVSYARILGIL